MTQSDKLPVLLPENTSIHILVSYLLFCVCYSRVIELPKIFCIYGEVCVKILCSEKELLNLKDSNLIQNFYGHKTGFVRLGHI